MADSESFFLGVDIGGTKVAAGIVSPRGEIRFKTRSPMVSDRGPEGGLAAVRSAIDAALGPAAEAGQRITAIGISSPGPLDPRRGVVLNPPNLACWRDYPLAQKVEQALGLPVRLDNDANAAGLAEARWGSGQGYPSVFYATIGTGIGTGIVFDGKIYHGRTGAAAEGGHVSIDYRGPECGCGKRGCIEALASGPAIARRARAALEGVAASRMLDLAGGKREAITAEIVAQASRAGDPIASRILEETADYLAIWLGSIVDLLEPDVIIFGGGMGELMSEWFEHIRAKLPAWSINRRAKEIPLVRARYGEDSGIAGAAALCREGMAASK